jgi:two-component system phosphate regulon sensor histidine kinase PhoR
MKKSTIWLLSTIMAVSFVTLLSLQVSYIDRVTSLRREQFEESVKRSLYAVAHKLELYETMNYLQEDAIRMEMNALPDSLKKTVHSYSIHMKDGQLSAMEVHSIDMPAKPTRNRSRQPITQTSQSLQDIIRKRYIHQRALLDEVVYNILYTTNNKPLEKRINFSLLDRDLQQELLVNGIDIPYHFTVSQTDGREIYRCNDYVEKRKGASFSAYLFRNDPPARMGVLKVHFPDYDTYMRGSTKFLLPSIFFTIILMISFIFSIGIIFRQKKFSEVKNDFINNMTHELKTPISTISLASQMLGDGSVTKSPEMQKHISGIINDETKRLRFLVEKVLQMSMFDRQNTSLKLRDINVNEIINSVVHTFDLKVQSYGGTLQSDLGATEAIVVADEMHITNVIFNLLDNAVKYRREKVPLTLVVRTWNESGKLCISVKDNGGGIKKDDLKHIFDKFYRVHTGNKHDVKGFGLGLAYVKKIINEHHGTIRTESEPGEGTTFIITLPTIKA